TRDSRRERIRRPDLAFFTPQNYDELRELQSSRDGLLEDCKADLTLMLAGNLPPGFAQMRGGGLVRLMRSIEDEHSLVRQRIQRWLEADRPRLRVQIRAQERFVARRKDI